MLGLFVIALLAFLLLPARPAAAQITFGTLSNFDVFNDTGQETHGFEIELDGLSDTDVIYTFGAPYNRYGDPIKVNFLGGVYVRYMSPYANGAFTERTVLAPSVITPTDGHACYAGGPIGTYDTSGCEHFGVALNGNPTNTIYRWLVADTVTPGNLVPAGTKVSIPAPVWNVTPQPAAQPIVQAVLPPQPPEAGMEFGEAQWVKVFVTEAADAVELQDLVNGNPAVEAAETEIEWVLLQASANPEAADDLVNEAPLGEGNESVTRRYEYYQYTGQYDPETHEALCDNPTEPAQQVPDICGEPVDGLAGVGNYIGSQIAAINLAVAAPIVLASSPLGDGEVGVSYNTILVSGGVGTFTINVTSGTLPAGLNLSNAGVLSGTPTATYNASFTIDVTDQATQNTSGSFAIQIVSPVAVTTTSLPVGHRKKSYSATLTAVNGQGPYVWDLTAGTLPAGLSYDPSGVISGVATAKAKNSSLTFTVTDALGGTATKTLSLTVH